MHTSILFITFYGLIDYIEEIINCFESIAEKKSVHFKHLTIDQYPYLAYQKDMEMKDEQIQRDLIRIISEQSITHVFWFFLPGTPTLYQNIKKAIPSIKFIFYNFDDSRSLNVGVIRIARLMDYFIQPNIADERRWSFLLGKKVYTIPNYVHTDLLQFRSSINQNNLTIIIEDLYKQYDLNEKIALDRYIDMLKDVCIDNDWILNVYGDPDLEKIYPDCYLDTLDPLYEGLIFAKSIAIVVLDIRKGIDKSFSQKLINASLSRKKVFTNSMDMIDFLSIFPNIELSLLGLSEADVSMFVQNIKNSTRSIDSPNIGGQDIEKYNITGWVGKIMEII